MFPNGYFQDGWWAKTYWPEGPAIPVPAAPTVQLVLIDGVPVEFFEIEVAELTGDWWGLPAISIQSTPNPPGGIGGSTIAQNGYAYTGRRCGFRGRLMRDTNEFALQTIRHFTGHLNRIRPHRVTLATEPGKHLVAEIQSCTVRPLHGVLYPGPLPVMRNGEPTTMKFIYDVEVEFFCADPYWRADSPNVLSPLGTLPLPLPMGNAETELLIVTPGPFTGPITFTYASFLGTTIAELTVPASPLAGEFLVLDTATMTARLNTTGLPSGGTIIGYSGEWPRPRPGHWDHIGESWATLKHNIPAASATVTWIPRDT